MPYAPTSRFFSGAGVLALGLALAFVHAARADLPTLYVNYNANCTFSLVDDSGTAVTTLPPGVYQLVVATPFVFAAGGATCDSVEFSFAGPGASVVTDLGGGDSISEQFTVRLQPSSSYTLEDSDQPSLSLLTITTTASGSPAPVSGPPAATTPIAAGGTSSSDVVGSASAHPAAPVARGTLTATVPASGKISLSFKGHAVAILKAGRYTVTVTDRSPVSGFTLEEIHGRTLALSGLGFVGKRSHVVTLTAGQWLFYPTFLGAKSYFVVTN